MNHPLTITHDSTGGYTTIYDTNICVGLSKDELLGTLAAWLYSGTPQFTGVKVADLIKPTTDKIERVARAMFNCSDYRNRITDADWDAVSQEVRDQFIDLAKVAHGQFTSNV